MRVSGAGSSSACSPSIPSSVSLTHAEEGRELLHNIMIQWPVIIRISSEGLSKSLWEKRFGNSYKEGLSMAKEAWWSVKGRWQRQKYQGLAWSWRLLCVAVWRYVISFSKQVICCCCLCCLTRWKRSKQVHIGWHVDATTADVVSHLSSFQCHYPSLNLCQLWFWISVWENHLHYRCPLQTLKRENNFHFLLS